MYSSIDMYTTEIFLLRFEPIYMAISTFIALYYQYKAPIDFIKRPFNLES